MLCYVFLVDFPDRAAKSWKFLNQKECDFIVRRINNDRKDGDSEAFSLIKFLRPAADLKIWGFAMIFLSVLPKAAVRASTMPRRQLTRLQLPNHRHLRNRLLPTDHPHGRYGLRRRSSPMPCCPSLCLRRYRDVRHRLVRRQVPCPRTRPHL